MKKLIFVLIFALIASFIPAKVLNIGINVAKASNIMSLPKENDHVPLPKEPKEIVSSVPILMFHDVAPLPNNATTLQKSLTISPEVFSQMMEYLYKEDFKPITLKELNYIWTHHIPIKNKLIVLTFDDGDKGVYQYAYPILKKYNFPFVIFLITKHTPTQSSFYMDESEVKEMLSSGLCEVGTHTRDHVNLKRVGLITKTYEIKACTDDVKKMFGFYPTSFCYPFGGYDSATIYWLKQSGYTMATTEISGYANEKDNYLLLPRVRIDGRDGLGSFIAKVNLRKLINQKG